MAVGLRPRDPVVAELLEQLTSATDLTDACSVILERAARELELGRAVLVVQTAAGLRGAFWGLPEQHARRMLQALSEPDSAVLELIQHGAMHGGAPAVRPRGSFPPLDFSSHIAFTFRDSAQRPIGAVLLEAAEIDDTAVTFADLMARLGPALSLLARLDSLQALGDKAGRQRDLLTTIVNAMPDPVLLTDEANNIVLSNRRAEQLFLAHSDDSEGRRRAVQINNLLFSSLLTQSAIGTGDAGPRELNLVDAQDGSDLLFEVLSVPVNDIGGHIGVISVLRDITDLRHAVNELEVQFNRSRVAEHDARRERDRLNVILENVSDPILVTDEHTNIVLMNPEADRLFVVDEHTGRDRAARQHIEANDTRFTTLISNFLLRPEQRHIERLTVADPATGREFPVEVASSKILNRRGEPTAIVSVLHDLTQAEENERLARELQQLNDQLEDRIQRATVELEERNRRLEWQSFELQKASRLKSEFLANMSHELRTPINVILGYTSLMRERIYGALTEQQDEALTKTYRTSQHLLELINDILDLSKIEAGKMPLHIEPVFMAEVIAEVAESVQPMVRDRIEFRADVAPDLAPLRTDRTKVKQVLLNLLSNAIKFTQQGSVSITARALDGRPGVRMIVADTGIGIKAEHLEAIFEDFRQLDQSHTREYGGTGLGLSITRKLLSLLGGSIDVQSAYGAGTTFTIDLPSITEGRADKGRASGGIPAGS